jgi:hypothetical protein
MVDLFPDAGVLSQGCVELDHYSIKTIFQQNDSLTNVTFFTN